MSVRVGEKGESLAEALAGNMVLVGVTNSPELEGDRVMKLFKCFDQQGGFSLPVVLNEHTDRVRLQDHSTARLPPA
ncbi:hypothetical protein [Streptomyces sp. NPDC001307]|uniref:hypothetical protein n=1 Tax=Streptomyces sp. NPDC001307 TaxID=3364560 RepID=UPI00367CFD8D